MLPGDLAGGRMLTRDWRLPWAAAGRVRRPRGPPCGIPGEGKGLSSNDPTPISITSLFFHLQCGISRGKGVQYVILIPALPLGFTVCCAMLSTVYRVESTVVWCPRERERDDKSQVFHCRLGVGQRVARSLSCALGVAPLGERAPIAYF